LAPAERIQSISPPIWFTTHHRSAAIDHLPPGAMNGLMAEVLEGHIRCHVLDPKEKPNSERLLRRSSLWCGRYLK
jgi:hypothetical protein